MARYHSVPMDVNNRPSEGPQVMPKAWTLWYEPEEELGEDCQTKQKVCPNGLETPGQDRLMRGPSFETIEECHHAAFVMSRRTPDLEPGDWACLPTVQGNLHLCAGESEPNPGPCVTSP